MCTLSWQQHPGHLEIMFNRDELHSRPAAHPPSVESIDGTKVLSPRDPQGGGTWLAANEYGLIVCLLNNYGAQSRSVSGDQNGTFQSRGQLVRHLAKLRTASEVGDQLRLKDLSVYPPFVLVAFSSGNEPLQWLWDSQVLRENTQPESPVTTSSLFPRFVPFLRRRLFKRLTRNGTKRLTVEEQARFHRSRRPWPAAFSVAMARSDRGTVSLSHIQVDASQMKMHYWQGDPAENAHSPATQYLQVMYEPSANSEGAALYA